MPLTSLVFGLALFAHQYGVTCQKCHTEIPHLNEFGARFLAAGERMPGVQPGPAFPISVKVNLASSGLPKGIVDEIEVFTAGAIGARGSYFVEQYVVDGGDRGLLRDIWVNDRINPWNARIPLYVQAGQFTLPLPVDPETFRESAQHYTIFDQTIGNNPFTFFAPKLGAQIAIGDTLHGLSARVFAGPGYDRVSGLPKTGVDTMENVTFTAGALSPSFYHLAGERTDVPGFTDRFSRTGWGVAYARGKWTSESVLQTGWDSSTSGVGSASSGGFSQLRYAFGPRIFALARYEGTNDPLNGFARDVVVLAGYRPTHNSRFTIEHVISRALRATQSTTAQLTVGY